MSFSISLCLQEAAFLVSIGPIKGVLLNFNAYSKGQSNSNWVVAPRNMPVEDLLSSQFQIIVVKNLPQALT